MATNPDLILKFKHLIINNNNVNGRWMCDEEVIRYLRDDEGLPKIFFYFFKAALPCPMKKNYCFHKKKYTQSCS